MVEDYYAVLGVDRRASADEIKKAYRRLTLEYHPDRHPDEPDAQERYRQINAAYNVLSDTIERAKYDTAQRLPQLDLSRGFDGKTARDLLSNVFGDVFGTKKRERRRGRDLRYTLTIDLPEAVLGSSHEIEFEAPGPCETCDGNGTRPGGEPPQTCQICGGRGEVKGDGLLGSRTRCGRCDGTGLVQQDPCETCRGAGTVKRSRSFEVRIPPGTDAGAQKVLKDRGEPGRFGSKPGDLRVTVNVRPHAFLRRQGDEIRCEVPVSVTEAALGANVPVPTVDGVVMVDVPAGIASGTRLRLRGKGVPLPGAKRSKPGRGDQMVTVTIETPVRGTAPALDDALRQLERASASDGALPRRFAQRAALSKDDA